MKIGFIGLGKMGQQMVVRLIKGGHELIVTDLNASAVELAVTNGAVAAADRDAVVKSLGAHPVIWLMIPSQFVENEVDRLIEIMPAGSVIVDGGNSQFELTVARAAKANSRGISFVDVGTSGGVLGLTEGFSMMVGGEAEAVATVTPLIEALARPKGWAHLGPSGSGHYIKMIHNAIEYGMMESYAEGYRLLKEGKSFTGLDLAAIAGVWQHGSIIESQLGQIVEDVLSANSELTGVEGFVNATGEAEWTLDEALSQKIDMPAVQAAMDVRRASQKGKINFGTKLLAAMRTAFGGHAINKQ